MLNGLQNILKTRCVETSRFFISMKEHLILSTTKQIVTKEQTHRHNQNFNKCVLKHHTDKNAYCNKKDCKSQYPFHVRLPFQLLLYYMRMAWPYFFSASFNISSTSFSVTFPCFLSETRSMTSGIKSRSFVIVS